MRIFSNILILILSLSFFISPAMVSEHSEDHQMTEMSCCTGENHSCHDSSQTKDQHKKDRKKDCNDTSCPMNSNCQVQTLSAELISETGAKETEPVITTVKKTNNAHYSSLILKELIYSFWHPPKYIS